MIIHLVIACSRATAMPGIGDLPTSVLTNILLSATTHDDLLVHAALCARVHPEWRRAVMGSAAYGHGIVGRSRLRGAAEAQITAATERPRVLRKLSRTSRSPPTCTRATAPG